MSRARQDALSRMLAKDPQSLEGPLKYFGVFRGFVEDVVDPEQRGRVRVRIPALHGLDVTVESLPWAERMFSDGGNDNAGDYVPLRAGSFEGVSGVHSGDAVFVMFEGGDPYLPVVVGTWYSRPDGDSDLPDEVQHSSGFGQYRRRVMKSRHGHRLEFGDERSDFEIKLTTKRGDVLQIREADGGRGFHVTTAEGHKLSLQDEHPNSSGDEVLSDYDSDPDVGYELRQAVVDGSVVRQSPFERELPIPDRKPANGVVQSNTPGVAQGFGQKGIMLETSSGHLLHMRDVTNQGILLRSVDGHYMEIRDDIDRIRMLTVGGQLVELADDGSRVNVIAQSTVEVLSPTILFNCSQFTVNAAGIDFNQTGGVSPELPDLPESGGGGSGVVGGGILWYGTWEDASPPDGVFVSSYVGEWA